MTLYGNYSVDVLVDGKPVQTYYHNGQLYIEGRKGKTYQLRLNNRSSHRVEFVVSVDGLSITNGKKAGKSSTGYVMRPWQTVVIDGWLLDGDTAAAFKFGDKTQGYAAKSDEGDVANSGVIGLMIFHEKYDPPYRDIIHLNQWWNDPNSSGYKGMLGSSITSSLVSGSNQLMASTTNRRVRPGETKSALNIQPQAANFSSSIGTEFGEEVDMQTTKTTFERASESPAFTTSLFYGDAKDLNKLGITLEWQKKPTQPNPFPADGTYGCKPPVGWRRG